MKNTKIFNHLMKASKDKKSGFLVLIDPDKSPVDKCNKIACGAELEGADALLFGGSFLTANPNPIAKGIKEVISLPLILFPASAMQLSSHANAILYLSLISGRNPQLLIGEQVKAAPLIKRYALEAIPTGYMLIEGASLTSVEFMSGTIPLPRDKPELAWAHALAAEYLGMKMIYLEAGSGAEISVPNELISAVKEHVNIPVTVGGGIKTPRIAEEKVNAGADFVVIGSAIEKSIGSISEFADAIHGR